MPSLYPGELVTRPLGFGSIDAMWLALATLSNNTTLVTNGEQKNHSLVRYRGGGDVSVRFPVECSRVRSKIEGAEPSEGMVEASSAAFLGVLGRRRGPRGRFYGHRQ